MGTRWNTCERLRNTEGTLDAEIQSRGAKMRRADVDPETEWTTTRLSALRRIGRLSVLEQPFADIRIVARSANARAWLGQCTGSARALTDNEQAMASAGAAHGLLAPCIDGLPPSVHDEPGPDALWSYPEAAHWASITFDLDDEADRAGATWKGTRHEPFADLIADDERRTIGEIVLKDSEGIARAVPASAQRFAPEALKAQTLSRWLARFGRIREVRAMTDADTDYQLVRRGMPDAGGLGAVRLWPAIERVEEIKSGLYRYNALRHTLSEVSRKVRIFIDRAEQGTDQLFGRPAGVLVMSARMERLNAKYNRIGLSLALQSAGACIAAATVAGGHEGIAVRAIGLPPSEEWLEATGKEPSKECPIAMIAFGAQNPPNDEGKHDDASRAA